MASYRFLIQQLSSPFEGCEFHHVPRADNEAADTLAKVGSTRQAIPAGVSLEQLHKPSIKPSPESASIFIPVDPSVQASSATPATAPVPAALALPTPIAASATTTSPATITNPTPPSLESCRLDTQWVEVMEVDGELAATTASEIESLELATASSSAGAAEAPDTQVETEPALVSAPSWAQPILAFLLHGELPQEEAEERQIQH
ncbi:hypothetical protein ZWY2020_056390 [Hordeum vulgare]|nr:hypothetical protein ZWY2020_056390 [Hordeum vulgare]